MSSTEIQLPQPPPTQPVKILCVGDPHFKTTNGSIMISVIKQISDLVRQHQPDLVVNLGDTLDNHDNSNSAPFSNSYYFHSAMEKLTKLAVIVGNHDLPNNETFLSDKHFMIYLRRWKNTTVAGQSVKVINIKGNKIALVPYVEPGRFQEALDTNPETKNGLRVIFCHQEFKGAHYGIVSVKGDEWSNDKPLIISGHIHDYQLCQDNIIYVGTPISHTYGKERKKTISLFTLNPDGTYQQERFKLDIPVKVKLELNVDKLMKTDLKPGFDYKIVVKDVSAKIESFKKTDKYLTLKNKLGNNLKCLGETIVKQNIRINQKKFTFLGHLRKLVTDKREQKLYCAIFNKNLTMFKLQNRSMAQKRSPKANAQS